MKILVLNCGSSSLKYQFINMETEEVLAQGKYERIGEKEAFITHKVNGQKIQINHTAMNHEEAINFTLKQLIHPEYKVIDSLDEIQAIGHRLAHGGEKLADSVIIDENVIEILEEYTDLAPLHIPAGITGIKACQHVMPGKPMVGVFDTAFHQTIPEERYLYPIPYRYYEKYGVRKYGFHGTSHMYVSQRLAEIENKEIKNLKIVSCHLGQGSSICAIDGGKSADTSMGLTPIAGVPMITRCGDMDPAIPSYLMRKENLTVDQIDDILNKESGLYGISGLVPDFREIEKAANAGNKRAKIAVYQFHLAVAEYIAKYAVVMGGIDSIIFTGGIGENQITTRQLICEQLKFMGVEIDINQNNTRGEEIKITKDSSKIAAYVIPTNEELMIAKETKRLAK